MIRVHRDTDQVICLQIEHFASTALQENPVFAHLLDGPLVTINHHDPAFEDDASATINQFREYAPRLAVVGD